ncbi:MAG: Hsp20/alpha crystallin family protein [Minisyncoccia bacterium]
MAIHKKRSFFERLSGSVPAGSYDAFDDDPLEPGERPVMTSRQNSSPRAPAIHSIPEDDGSEGQLPVDVYQTGNEIVIRTFVAGVRPDELNVSIARDMVVIEGSREEREQVSDSDYFTRELFWGSFARTILLPQEVDVENSSATSKDGLLTLILPKLDKARQTKLKVRAG